MKTENVITVSISIPHDNNVVHTYSAELPYDGVEYDVMASDVLREYKHFLMIGNSLVNAIHNTNR